jgi:hypothetical protein
MNFASSDIFSPLPRCYVLQRVSEPTRETPREQGFPDSRLQRVSGRCRKRVTGSVPVSKLDQMDIRIEAGGSVHRLREEFATIVAEHLRAHPDPRDRDSSITAADKLERALVEEETEPIAFEPDEALWVERALQGPLTGHSDDPDLWALSSALTQGF